ncbi:type II secretion system F family protein, partial [Candidatus Saccharibacteria bacterium]|nr:type II secretion system F family protein [Candidatus Saccharibacteria bacterium]
MLTFKYTARDPSTGKKVTSQLEAENEQAASKLISKEGLTPIEITAKQTSSKGLGRFLHRIKAKDKVLFSRQLATLINAGLPLVQSLRNVV